METRPSRPPTGGNERISKAGSRIGTQMVAAALAGEGAAILAHEKVLTALSAPTGQKAAAPAAAWPTDTYFTDVRNLHFNGEAVQMLHQPAAHSDADSVIFFRRSDVIVTGDLFDWLPGRRCGARRNFSGPLDAVNRIVDLAIVKDWRKAAR
jgi:glyoxylase-like metal-dependent hydrolase (beta-lactamase superfamily II)